MSTPIPQPPTFPILGNVWDIDPKNGMQSLSHLAEKYGMYCWKHPLVGDISLGLTYIEVPYTSCHSSAVTGIS